MYNLDLRPLLWFGFVVVGLLWGAWEAIDYFFIDEVIESTTPITPELKLEIKNNSVDTVYVYRKLNYR